MNEEQMKHPKKYLTEEEKLKAAERLTDIVMGYDFFAAKEDISDVRFMVEELTEYHYGAFTSKEKQENLKDYFEGLRDTTDNDDARLAFEDALNVLERIEVTTIANHHKRDER